MVRFDNENHELISARGAGRRSGRKAHADTAYCEENEDRIIWQCGGMEGKEDNNKKKRWSTERIVVT